MKNVFLVTLCIYMLTTEVTALMCHICNDRIDLECYNFSKMSIHYHLCPPPTDENGTVTRYGRPLCRKVKQNIKVLGITIVKRSCGWELHNNIETDVCYESRYKDYEEIACQCFSDGCNAAKMQSANSAIVLTFGVLSLLLLYFRNK